MPTQVDKIKKIEAELIKLKAMLDKYSALFSADGLVDTKEQQKLDAMKEMIKKAEAKLAQLKQTSSSTPEQSSTTQSPEDLKKFLDDVEQKLKSLEEKYNIK